MLQLPPPRRRRFNSEVVLLLLLLLETKVLWQLPQFPSEPTRRRQRLQKGLIVLLMETMLRLKPHHFRLVERQLPLQLRRSQRRIPMQHQRHHHFRLVVQPHRHPLPPLPPQLVVEVAFPLEEEELQAPRRKLMQRPTQYQHHLRFPLSVHLRPPQLQWPRARAPLLLLLEVDFPLEE